MVHADHSARGIHTEREQTCRLKTQEIQLVSNEEAVAKHATSCFVFGLTEGKLCSRI